MPGPGRVDGGGGMAALGTARRRRRWATILGIGVASRLAILMLVLLGGFLPTNEKPTWREALSTWDGGHYAHIVDHGYEYEPERRHSNLAFFPLYPLLGRLVKLVVRDSRWALILISHAAFFALLWYLHALTRLEFDERSADRALLYVCLFPVAFIFSCAYTESLFLALATGTLYHARRQQWAVATALCMAATLTRITGVLLVLPLLWELWRHEGWRRRWFWLAGAAVGLAFCLYPTWQWWRFGSPLRFLEVQSNWDREYVWLAGTIWYSVKYFGSFGLATYNGCLNAVTLALLATLAGALAVGWRRLPAAYHWYAWPTLFVITATVVMQEKALPAASLIRYLLALLPAFMLLGRWGRRPALHYALIFLWAPLLGLLAAFFFCTFWVC